MPPNREAGRSGGGDPAESSAEQEQALPRRPPRVTWSDGGRGGAGRELPPRRSEADYPSPAPTAASSESAATDSLSPDGNNILLPEQIDDLEEMRALLPTLRRVQSILEDEKEAPSSSLRPAALHDSATLVGGDDGGVESEYDDRRSLGRSILQHISPGISTARRRSDDSSSSSSSSPSSRQEYVRLSRDVYSLIYFCPPRSLAFLFALGTFVFQIFILALILLDIIDADSYNSLNIPAGASITVRMAQFVAILISVATQDDLITSINELHVGYYRKALTGEGVHELGGAKWQWLLSLSTRFAQGGLCLAVTFILIMQSIDVVGLFLDFLAVTFVSTLDDIMFTLADEGYFSQSIKKETDAVCRIHVPKKEIDSQLFRPMLFLFVSAWMLMDGHELG